MRTRLVRRAVPDASVLHRAQYISLISAHGVCPYPSAPLRYAPSLHPSERRRHVANAKRRIHGYHFQRATKINAIQKRHSSKTTFRNCNGSKLGLENALRRETAQRTFRAQSRIFASTLSATSAGAYNRHSSRTIFYYYYLVSLFGAFGPPAP